MFLAEEGISVAHGDAPGYVPDHVCAECHADKAESFAEMGMARSFYRPSPDKVIEDFSDEAYFHEVTQRLYGMELRDGDYWFTRHTRTGDGTLLDRFEIKVDWIMGSGNHSRVYLFQSDDGALFQLPLAWYTQDRKWAMAPGFEFAGHLGVIREVPQRCMSCHNAFAAYPEGAGEVGMPRHFPHDLPEGIGCQRCHGPGAEHVYRAYSGEGELEDLHAAIVHPGKLPREQLYSICYGCHMQPTVSVNSQLRFGRGHYSFRPGEDIREFLAHIDIVDATRTKEERFDINHHPYRLEQSACFVESQGQLGCLTCHDPHVKIKPEERAAHYRAACLSCHTLDEQGLPVQQSGAAHPDIASSDDCTSCHMPNRRTQDVVEVWMTDHKITRQAADGLLDPFPKEPAVVSEVFLSDPDSPVSDDDALSMKLIAILEYTARQSDYAADALLAHLQANPTSDFEPYLHLLQSLVRQGRNKDAHSIATQALARNPDHPRMIQTVAMSYAINDEPELGVLMLKNLLEGAPHLVDARYNLAVILSAMQRQDEALAEAERVLEMRPTHWQTWRLVARVSDVTGDKERALKAYLRALEIEPRNIEDRGAVVERLTEAGRLDQAKQHQSMLTQE